MELQTKSFLILFAIMSLVRSPDPVRDSVRTSYHYVNDPHSILTAMQVEGLENLLEFNVKRGCYSNLTMNDSLCGCGVRPIITLVNVNLSTTDKKDFSLDDLKNRSRQIHESVKDIGCYMSVVIIPNKEYMAVFTDHIFRKDLDDDCLEDVKEPLNYKDLYTSVYEKAVTINNYLSNNCDRIVGVKNKAVIPIIVIMSTFILIVIVLIIVMVCRKEPYQVNNNTQATQPLRAQAQAV